jgi:hypothetical protein
MDTIAIKAIAGIVLLAALAGAGYWCVQTIHKANERDAAVARVAQVEKEKTDMAKSFADASAANVSIAGELAALRTEMAKRLGKFSQALTSQPLTLEVPRETALDAAEPCRARDPVRYRELFNQAVAGAP